MDKTVVLVDDHDMLRNGLRSFIEQNSVWRVTGEASSADEAMVFFDSAPEPPAAAIVDISLPETDGIDLVGVIRKRSPATACIVYSMHVTAGYIQSALNAGALSYVSKSSPADEILHALDAVVQGNPYLDSSVLKIHLAQFSGSGRQEGPSPLELRDSLTFQEDRVFMLAAKNMNNAEIAGALSIKVKTVENYVSIVYQKLGVRNRFELLEFARNAGIVR